MRLLFLQLTKRKRNTTVQLRQVATVIFVSQCFVFEHLFYLLDSKPMREKTHLFCSLFLNLHTVLNVYKQN